MSCICRKASVMGSLPHTQRQTHLRRTHTQTLIFNSSYRIRVKSLIYTNKQESTQRDFVGTESEISAPTWPPVWFPGVTCLAASKRDNITGGELLLISRQVFGPPNTAAPRPLRNVANSYPDSSLLQTANDSKSNESTAREQAT